MGLPQPEDGEEQDQEDGKARRVRRPRAANLLLAGRARPGASGHPQVAEEGPEDGKKGKEVGDGEKRSKDQE